MKKIELELSAISHSVDKNYEYHINTVLGVLRELVDAHNELLDTHTVKVKEEHLCLNGVVGTTCNNPECQPTTPEKKIHTAPMKKCKICKMDYCPECFEFCPMCPRPSVSDRHQEEKLPTSSYEVTCGRCEKSIKHSCGAVK